MNHAALEAVLFDMDGTLFDSERIWDVSLQDLASKLGGTLSPEARLRIVGSNLLNTVRIVQDDIGVHDDDQRLAKWLLDRTQELFSVGVPWRPTAPELVAGVRSNGIPAALVTGSYRVLVDVVLDQLPADTFDVVLCGDEVTHPKPHPEPYLIAASRLGVNVHNTVAIEDSQNGIESAVAAGCVVVAVPEDPQTLPEGHGATVAPLSSLTVDWLSTLMDPQPRGRS
ncbi:HAD family hydrolase [Kribbella sp. NPDC054772]